MGRIELYLLKRIIRWMKSSYAKNSFFQLIFFTYHLFLLRNDNFQLMDMQTVDDKMKQNVKNNSNLKTTTVVIKDTIDGKSKCRCHLQQQ